MVSPRQDYAGTWTGTYTVSSCTNGGFFADAGFCGSVLNTTAGVTFVLAQSDRTVTGIFSLGSLSFPSVSASIGGDESLTLAASQQDGQFTIEATWTLQQSTATVLAGQTRQVWKAAGRTGEGVLQGSIVSVGKAAGVGALPSARERPAGPALSIAPLLQKLLERAPEVVGTGLRDGDRPASTDR
jgi:hypothetical protein